MAECRKCEREHEPVTRVEWGWALRQSGVKPSARGVIDALADHMDPATGCGWISLQQLAAELSTSRDTVMRAVKWAQQAGFVFQAVRGHGHGGRDGRAVASWWELRVPDLSSTGATKVDLSSSDLSSKNGRPKSQNAPTYVAPVQHQVLTCTRRDLEQVKDIPPLASLAGAHDDGCEWAVTRDYTGTCDTHGTPLCSGHCHACWDADLARNRADLAALQARSDENGLMLCDGSFAVHCAGDWGHGVDCDVRDGHCQYHCITEENIDYVRQVAADRASADDETDTVGLRIEDGMTDTAAAIRSWPALRGAPGAMLATLAAMILNISTDRDTFTLEELAACMGSDATADDAREGVKVLAESGLLDHLADLWRPYGRALPVITDLANGAHA